LSPSDLVRLSREAHSRGLVGGIWGNASIRSEGGMTISPSGFSLADVEERTLVEVALDGSLVSDWAGISPSSEWRLHSSIYAARSEVLCVLHVHPPRSVALSLVGDFLPPVLEEMAMLCGPVVRVADYAPPGTEELARSALRALGDGGAVILRNHGLVCVGRSVDEVLATAEVCEKAAEVYLLALSTGLPVKPLPEAEATELRRRYLEGYGRRLWGASS